jgi:hypothetical protein
LVVRNEPQHDYVFIITKTKICLQLSKEPLKNSKKIWKNSATNSRFHVVVYPALWNTNSCHKCMVVDIEQHLAGKYRYAAIRTFTAAIYRHRYCGKIRYIAQTPTARVCHGNTNT